MLPTRMTERIHRLRGVGGECVKSAIGIDPDSRGFVCALVMDGKTQATNRRFSVSQEGLESSLTG